MAGRRNRRARPVGRAAVAKAGPRGVAAPVTEGQILGLSFESVRGGDCRIQMWSRDMPPTGVLPVIGSYEGGS
jgi:hypothetical protein